jgi:HlyD family secretion protein
VSGQTEAGFGFRARSALVLCFALGACDQEATSGFQGYAEGEYVRVASSFVGRLEKLNVHRGDQVKAGDPLFSLENENEAAARAEAEQRLRAAQAQLANLRKGRRPTEIAAVEAQLDQARAAARLSEAQLKRSEQLVGRGFISREKLDEARSAHASDRARVEQLQADLATARLAARQDEIRAAQHSVEAAQAVLTQAEWRLEQKSVRAPVSGLVADTLFVKGEWVPAGAPVATLLPPENIKVRFFVPEPRLGAVRVGQGVSVACDGCAAPVPARITFISPRAEYTPPVIYSRETRSKLVYLIEARPAVEDARKLHPGQPVDVRLEAAS